MPRSLTAPRLVAWARERAHQLTFQRLESQLTDRLRATLDGLLSTAEGGRSQHAWLRARPMTVSTGAVRRELEKRAFLIEPVGADRFELGELPPNRWAWLAQTGRQSSNQAIARLAPERRYPVLMCFCAEALERATDDALEVFDRAHGTADRGAPRKREELLQRSSRETQTTVRRFIDLSRLVLEAHDSGTDALRLIDRQIGVDCLRADLERAQEIARPPGDGHIDLLIDGAAASGRKLLAAVIASIEFKRTGTDDDELLAALRMIGELAGNPRRWLPGSRPAPFSRSGNSGVPDTRLPEVSIWLALVAVLAM